MEHGEVRGVRTAGGIYEADIVVSNTDMHHTETRLLDPRYQSYKERSWAKRTLAPSAFIIYLGVRGKLESLRHHNLYFCEDWRTNFAQIFDSPAYPENPSLYVCCPSRTDPTTAPTGHENLFVLVPVAPGLPDNESIRAQYMSYILDLISKKMNMPNLSHEIVTSHIFSVNDFATRYNSYNDTALGLARTMRQSVVFRPSNRSKKVRGLYYVGADTNPGVGMPTCLISAQLAHRRIIHGK